jgi:MYXO-CTERM domain-containing protein
VLQFVLAAAAPTVSLPVIVAATSPGVLGVALLTGYLQRRRRRSSGVVAGSVHVRLWKMWFGGLQAQARLKPVRAIREAWRVIRS